MKIPLPSGESIEVPKAPLRYADVSGYKDMTKLQA
jgi:hypothetical protein